MAALSSFIVTHNDRSDGATIRNGRAPEYVYHDRTTWHCAVLWAKDIGAKDIHKEVLPLYGEHCFWCQAVHNWVQHQRDSPKVNVLCAVSSQYVHLILLCCRNRYWHDVSPAHFHCEVHQYLNTVLPGCWIGHASENYHTPMLWPQRSPGITPCDFFFGDMSKTGDSSHHCHVTSLT